MRKFLLFLFVIGFSLNGITSNEFSQVDFFKNKKLNRRAKDPLGLNLYFIGPVSGAGISIDYFITPKFALEAVAGFRDIELNNAFSLGLRYHFFGKTFLSLTPYIGLYTGFHHNQTTLQNHAVYVPVGLHKIKKSGFSWSAEIAWQNNLMTSNSVTCGFRIGYRF